AASIARGASSCRRPRRRRLATGATGRHEQADLVLVGGPPVARRDNLAAVHDRDPIRQLEDLVELRRHEQDRRARIALRDRLTVDELDAADVEPARRLVEDEEPRLGPEFPGDDDLLLVRSEERRVGKGWGGWSCGWG